ncbi:T9SS type A sorting domain-containing protein [Portibacter marinus]|uniref:T9SS type A sorting domain-containing protein n=1 Tax=Portibacter marinus TaxID=2898660 RepID=UPI001F1C1A00|nr:T9SS type A sorting domain-containing protein [Portibacter marinus]
MKQLMLSTLFLLTFSFYGNGQTTYTSTATHSEISLANLTFTIYPNPTDRNFQLEFLLPKSAPMEMYVINTSGDPVKHLLKNQMVDAGVKSYDFEFPEHATFGIYFLVIKSGSKAVVRKIEFKAGT